MAEPKPIRHPGKTNAQRRVLDAIGCGNVTPPMSNDTRNAMISRGLIVELPDRVIGRDKFGAIKIPAYEMPIPVHMQWCDFMSAQPHEEDHP